MQSKKSESANVEKHRFTFFLVGILLALLSVVSAFTLKIREPQIRISGTVEETTWVLTIPQVKIKDEKLVEPKEELKIEKPKSIQLVFKPDVKEEEKMPNLDSLLDNLNKDIDQFAKLATDTVDYELPKIHEGYEVDEMPSFPGGVNEMQWFLSQIIIYPEMLKNMGIEGKALISFTVDKNGTIRDIKALISDNEAFEQEAIRSIRQMPKWNPGKVKGTPVNVKMVIPIKFKLN